MLKFVKQDGKLQLIIFGIKISFNKRIKGQNNNILVRKNGKLCPCKKRIKGLDILIRGSNNTIIVETPEKISGSTIRCIGNNNKVIIYETIYGINSLFVDLGHKMDNRIVTIGKNIWIGGAGIHAWTNNSTIEIGENCLLSWGIEIMSGDAHKILDKQTKKVINNGNYCKIGNNVWIGCNVFIGKNVIISDNNIVGACSVVTKPFEQSNTVIAGSPAKVVRYGVEWDRDINF